MTRIVNESEMMKALARHFDVSEVEVIRKVLHFLGLSVGTADCDLRTFNADGRVHLTGLREFYKTIRAEDLLSEHVVYVI